MRLAILALLVVSNSAFSKTITSLPDDTGIDREEFAAQQMACGDDILCYFTNDEIREALGSYADQDGIERLFKIGSSDPFSAEEKLIGELNDALNSYAMDGGRNRPMSPIKESATAARRDKSKNSKSDEGGSLQSTGLSPRGAPAWYPFVKNFKQCAKGCIPYIVSVWRPGAVSCHASGRAIDVGAIICKGQTHRAINNGRFAQFVSCMRPKMKTLFHDHDPRVYGVTGAHYDHGHFSTGCIVQGGRRYY